MSTEAVSMESLTASIMEFSRSVDGVPIPDFVDLDPKYTCIDCRKVLYMPRQLPCGHRICKPCVEKLLSEAAIAGTVVCPSGEDDCIHPVKREEVYPDNSAQRELRKLSVYCLYHESGCEQTMPWSQYKAHIEQCIHRLQRCRYCRKEFPLSVLQTHIDAECPSVEVACPYQCETRKILRSDMSSHVENCPSRPRPCYMQNFGCSFEAGVGELELHEADHVLHIKILASKLTRLETELSQVASASAYTIDDSLLVHNDEHLYTIDAIPATVGEQSQTVNLLRQNVQDVERLRQRLDALDRTPQPLSSAKDELSSLSQRVLELGKHLPQLGELVKAVQERVARLEYEQAASYDGTLIWKIVQFYSKLLAAKNGTGQSSFYSLPFYTHRFGYKLCACIYLNGDGSGQGTHLSLFVAVMKGDYDDILPWPFNANVRFSIMDQSSNRKHLSEVFRPDPGCSQKPTGVMNVAVGSPQMVSHELLMKSRQSVDEEGRQFLLNDTLYIRVIVEQLNVKNI